ncbi:MAG: caspase family protein [Rubrivivax sp.]
MPLEIVPSRSGLWRDPAWAPGMPGLYALIAGVSAYPHLDGGAGPTAPDTHGLEQLLSSAHTAATVFQWLRDGFHHGSMPVVWCQLLLSPTAAERARLDADGLKHYAEPTFVNLQQAIQLWAGNMPRAAAAAASRSFFFFSGHGVQSNWNALLLPSDYLDPSFGQPVYENCISTAELRKWMEENPVAEHLALLDACRNEFSPLASKGATAHSVFPQAPAGGAPPRTAATLAAASPNTVAFQLHGRPLTLFGEAVLEAFRGAADPSGTELPFRELVDYVKPRVNVLLKEAAGTTLEQTVRPRIDGDDHLIVTEIHRPTTRSGAPMALQLRAPLTRGAGAPAETQAIAARAQARLVVDPTPIGLEQLRTQGGEAHRRFGHEYASNVWIDGGVALYTLGDRARLPGGAELLAVSRDEASSIVHVDLALDPAPDGVLLVFEGAHHVQRERLAVALPTDRHERVPVRLTITIAAAHPGEWPRMQSLSARLGPGPWNPHYAYLWNLAEQEQLSSLREAAERADPQRLLAAARDKVQAQAAAAAGMLLLARAGRLERVGDWPRNLMQMFPSMPDGAVLWAEALRQARASGAAAPFGTPEAGVVMAEALVALLQRGVPFFADALDLADSLVREALRVPLLPARQAELQMLRAALSRVFELAMPGGDFVVLPGLPRPGWLGGGPGSLTVVEMLRVLRGPGD